MKLNGKTVPVKDLGQETYCWFFRDFIRNKHIPLFKQIQYYKNLHCTVAYVSYFPSAHHQETQQESFTGRRKHRAFGFGFVVVVCLFFPYFLLFRPCQPSSILPSPVSRLHFPPPVPLHRLQAKEQGYCNRIYTLVQGDTQPFGSQRDPSQCLEEKV